MILNVQILSQINASSRSLSEAHHDLVPVYFSLTTASKNRDSRPDRRPHEKNDFTFATS